MIVERIIENCDKSQLKRKVVVEGFRLSFTGKNIVFFLEEYIQSTEDKRWHKVKDYTYSRFNREQVLNPSGIIHFLEDNRFDLIIANEAKTLIDMIVKDLEQYPNLEQYSTPEKAIYPDKKLNFRQKIAKIFGW